MITIIKKNNEKIIKLLLLLIVSLNVELFAFYDGVILL